MQVNDFMSSLCEQLKKEKDVSESSCKLYLANLYMLNGKKPFKNLTFLKNKEDITAKFDKYAQSTKSNILGSICSILSLVKDKPAYKSTYKYYYDCLVNKDKELKEERGNTLNKTEKEKENWIDWNIVEEKKEALKKEVESYKESSLSPHQYNNLLSYVILSLYTDVPPRRNQDYQFMNACLCKKFTEEKDKNYYHNGQFIFNRYKTSKKSGEQRVDVPESLQHVLALYFKHHPLANKKAPFPLLVKSDGSSFTTINAITRILNKLFGKRVGSSMLRHSYLSHKYGDTLKEMQEDSEAMAHSTEMQSGYIRA